MKYSMMKRYLCILLCLFIALPFVNTARSQQTTDITTEVKKPSSDILPDYTEYLLSHALPTAQDSYVIAATDFSNQQNCTPGDDTVLTTDNGFIEWTVDVPRASLYQIGFVYKGSGEDVADIEREIRINGHIPFAQARSISFNHIWKNNPEDMDGDKFKNDNSGNQLTPSQIQADLWNTLYIQDIRGSRVKPYNFAFKKGTNTIRISGLRGGMIIKSLIINVTEDANEKSYTEYLADHKHGDYTGGIIVVQGEEAALKSSSALVPLTDRTSPSTVPSHPVNIRLNTIGGSNWSTPGQWIEWTINVPNAGFYSLGLKYRQNMVSGMFTTRSLYINGEIPFDEMSGLEFAYNSNWQGHLLSDYDGAPYKFYFKKGDNTLRLQVETGRASDIYARADETVRELNTAYRQIIMLTSSSPDPLRNYRIDKVLPEVMETFRRQSQELKGISDKLAEISSKKGSLNTIPDNLHYQLQSFINDPITIPSRLDSYKQNVSGMAAWLFDLASQPLEIDYITLSAPTMGTPKEIESVNAGFFEKFIYEVKAFIGSYLIDYSTLGGIDGSKAKTSIDVWINSGRDQAATLKKLTDSRFMPDYGIQVNVKMTASVTGISSLLLATVSGMGPDVALNLTNAEPVNYASRGAAINLSGFDGFDKVTDRFMDSAMEPYEYQGGYFALPETQGFPMMFYRTDIMEEMQLSPPRTWDEMVVMLGELQKKHMTVGIPGDISYLATRIYQSGESLYNEDKSRSLLGSQTALTQFKDWTNLYTGYSLPLDYDAANRFRTGEMPLVIADYSFFNRISVLAPELKGFWGFDQIPGTIREDGTIDNTAASTGACLMMLASAKQPQASWEFMKWWTSEEIQIEYGRQLEGLLGVAARHNSANIKAMKSLPWKTDEYKKLFAAWQNTRGIPEVPGSYYVPRNVENALRRVLSYSDDPQEVLKEYGLTINDEIQNKRREFGLEQ